MDLLKNTLFFVLLLNQLAYSSEQFPRPWHNSLWQSNNSYIMHVNTADVWLPGVFNLALEGLELEETKNALNEKYQSKIAITITKKNTAYVAAQKCSDIYQSIQNNPPNSALNILNSIMGGAWQGVKMGSALGAVFGGVLTLPSGGAGAIPGALIGGTGGALIGGLKGGFDALFSNTNDKRTIELSNACSDYGTKWRDAMDNAIDNIELGLNEIDKTWNDAYYETNKLVYAGLCETDYVGIGKENCVELKSAFKSEGNKISAASADFSAIAEYFENFKSNLYSELPSTKGYSDLLILIWGENGAVLTAKQIKEKAEAELSSATLSYNYLISQSKNEKENVEELIAKMKKHNIQKITEGSYFSGVLESSDKSEIAESFEEIKALAAIADTAIKTAAEQFNQKKTNYLKNAINNVENAIQIYKSLIGRLSQLEADASLIVDQKQAEAEQEINNFEFITKDKFVPKDALSSYEQAKKTLQDASRQTTLGDKFEYLDKAAYFARSAKNIFENKPLEKLVELNALSKNIENLLSKALSDDIDVHTENAEFSLLKNTEEPWLLENLKNIENSIISKARVMYSNLEKRRKSLIEQIELGKEETIDLKLFILEAENGAFDRSGNIIYNNAIGKLKSISSSYDDTEKELARSKKTIVANSIIKNIIYDFDKVELDKPAEISATFFINNPSGYSAENVQVLFDLPFDVGLNKNNIIKGSEKITDVLQDGKNIKLLVKNIEPYSSYAITFNKKKIIATSLKKEINAVGDPDGSAFITEIISFDLTADAMLSDSNYPNGFEIDGFLYDNKMLEKGKHDLKYSYSVPYAFDLIVDNYNTNKIGLKTKIEYDVLISPNMGINKIRLFLTNDERLANLDIVSLTGEKITNIQKFPNGMLMFDVIDAKSNKTIKLRILYYIEDTTTFIKEKLDLFSNSNLTINQKLLLDEAKTSFSKNDSETALKKVTEIDRTIVSDNAEKSKLEALHKDLLRIAENQLSRIENAVALADLKSLNNEFLDKLKFRGTELRSLINKNQEVSENSVDALKEIDQSWDKKEVLDLKKEIFKDYNKLKEDYYSTSKGEKAEEFGSFSELENALNKLDATNSLDDSIIILEKFSQVKDELLFKQNSTSSTMISFADKFNELKNTLKNNIDLYKRETSAAKSSRYSNLFRIDSSNIDKALKQAEKDLTTNKNIQDLDNKLENLEQYNYDIENVLNSLKKDAEGKLINIENLFKDINNTLNEENSKKFSNKIIRINTFIENKEYVNALKASDSLLEEFQNLSKKDDRSLLIIGVTALFIVGALGLYIFKVSKGKKTGDGKTDDDGDDENKKIRKLSRINEQALK